jgi:hypothetical protein
MVNVTNRADVNVWLIAFKLTLGHGFIPEFVSSHQGTTNRTPFEKLRFFMRIWGKVQEPRLRSHWLSIRSLLPP